MNDHESESGSTVKREFYAPATFQFATGPGRIERTLGRLFRERGSMDGRPRALPGMREFYAPATFQFATEPGRIERLVAGTLRQRGTMDGRRRTSGSEHVTSGSSTTRTTVTRRGRRPEAR